MCQTVSDPMVNRLPVDHGKPSGKPGSLWLVIPDSVWESIMPDVCNRASILGSFQIDSRLRLAGMTRNVACA